MAKFLQSLQLFQLLGNRGVNTVSGNLCMLCDITVITSQAQYINPLLSSHPFYSFAATNWCLSSYSCKMFFRVFLCLFLISNYQISCCLTCDRESNKRFREFKYFLNDQHDDFDEFTRIRAHSVKMFNQLMGVLEKYTLDSYGIYQMAMEFKKFIDLIENSEVKGLLLLNTVTLQFKKLQKNSIEIMLQYYSERHCPNLKNDMNCGLMQQTVTNCGSCEEEKVLCIGGPQNCKEKISQCPMCICDANGECRDVRNGKVCTPCQGFTECLSEVLNCGARYVDIEEEEDIIFDCGLVWHTREEQPMEYVFERVGQGKSRPLSVTNEPYLVKKFASKSDEGEYKCTAQSKNKFPMSTLTFIVKVKPASTKTYKTRPTLPPEDITDTQAPTGVEIQHSLTNSAVRIIAVSGACLVVLIIAIRMYTYKRNKNLDKEMRDKHMIYEEAMLPVTN